MDARGGTAGFEPSHHIFGKGGIFQQDSAIENELDGLMITCQMAGAGGGIGSQGFGGFGQDGSCQGIAQGRGAENRNSKASHVSFISLDGPIDQIVRHIQGEGIQDQGPELWPGIGTVRLSYEGAEGLESDLRSAAAIPYHMTAATNFGRAAIRRGAITTRAGAAEHQHAGGHGGLPWSGGERGFEVIGSKTGDFGKNPGSGAADAFPIFSGAGPGETNSEGAKPSRGDRQAAGDFLESPLQFAVG